MANLTHVLKRKQVFSASDLTQALGGKTKIPILIEGRRLKSVGRGYYATGDLDHWEALVLVAARYFPAATLSGLTALKIHGLYDSQILEVQADIDRSTNQKNSLIKFKRVSKSKRCGIVKRGFHGTDVSLYEPERCLADLAAGRTPRAVLETALTNYLNAGRVDIEKLRFYDELFKVNLSKQIEKLMLKKTYVRPQEASPQLSPRDQIVRTAISRYALMGEAGLNFKDVAYEAGVGVSSVAYYFADKLALAKAVFDGFESNFLNSGLKEFFEENPPPVEFAKRYAQLNMDLADKDEVQHRVQMWALAERNRHVMRLMENVCNPLVATLTEKIRQQVKGISVEEAELRAILFGSTLDQYGTMKWHYSHIMNGTLTRKRLMTGYRKMLADDLVDLIFAPPRLETAP